MTEAPPWTTLERRVLLEDRWIKLRADRLRTDRGAEISPWYVLEYPDWAVVVPLTDDDRVVMIRQWRHAAQAWCLELPGGVMDPEDGDAVETCRRELREETGHGAREFRYLYAGHPNPAIQTNRLHVVLATGAADEGVASLDEGETMRVELLPVQEAVAAALGGGLGQAMHVGALLAGLAAVGRIRL